jgi:hypothetical protein
MKTNSLKKYIAAGVTLGGLLFQTTLRADVEVVFAGGNASQNVLYDRVTNILTGGISSVTIASTNAVVRTYVGTITGSGLGTVTIDFSLLGAVGGLQDINSQSSEATALGSYLPPTVAVSSTSAEAVGISSSSFTETKTLGVPFVFIKNTKWPGLAGITNLTREQASYLEGAAGTLPTTYFGGSSSSPIYLVARNTASAVRTEIDLNVGFSGSISTWTTNNSSYAGLGGTYVTTPIGQPVPDPLLGQSSGSPIRTLLGVITNSIGTVAAQDVSTTTPIAYEGVPFSVTNVENGSYPIWSYERWFWKKTGQTGAPSPNQYQVITNLLAAVTNATFQTTSPLVTGNFARLSLLQVSRAQDGGPITSLLY